MITTRKTLAVLICTGITVLTLACMGSYDAGSEPQYPNSISDSRDLEIYFFNPNMSLKMLQQESVNILLRPLTATTANEYLDSAPIPLENEVNLWKYDDYLKLANVIQRQTWGDDANLEWNLLSMSFSADCEDPLAGFSTTDLYYFRLITIDGKSKYAVRGLLIRPLYGDIIAGSGSNYPHPLSDDWKSIDLSKFKITSDRALQIAEKNGGKNFRVAGKNNCYVNLYIGSEGWNIIYTSTNRQNPAERFKMSIDLYTGNFEISGH